MCSGKRRRRFRGDKFHGGQLAHQNNEYFTPTKITCYTVVQTLAKLRGGWSQSMMFYGGMYVYP